MSKLVHKLEYRDTSPEGINYRVVHWKREDDEYNPHGIWNYYVLLPKEQFTKEVWEKIWIPVDKEASERWKRPIYDYYNSILNSANWHHGVTSYEKHSVSDWPDNDWVEVGCDYNHYWDEENKPHYDVNWVSSDALRTCADLAKILGPIKVRCAYTHNYFDPKFNMSDEVFDWKGKFLSPAGCGARSRWDYNNFQEKLENHEKNILTGTGI